MNDLYNFDFYLLQHASQEKRKVMMRLDLDWRGDKNKQLLEVNINCENEFVSENFIKSLKKYVGDFIELCISDNEDQIWIYIKGKPALELKNIDLMLGWVPVKKEDLWLRISNLRDALDKRTNHFRDLERRNQFLKQNIENHIKEELNRANKKLDFFLSQESDRAMEMKGRIEAFEQIMNIINQKAL